MKKNLLFVIILLAGIFLQAPGCDDYIDLIGEGIAGIEEATISHAAYDLVEKVLVEAIFKSTEEPADVRFWSGSDELVVSRDGVLVSGLLGSQYHVAVYNAIFGEPEKEIHLDFPKSEHSRDISIRFGVQ